MNYQTLILKFSDLKNLSTTEIIKAIAPQISVKMTLKGINDNEVSAQEAYKIWATSLFKTYGPNAINDHDLRLLFDVFSLAIQELLDECGECQNDEQINKLYEIFNYSLELFSWIQSTTEWFERNKITAFLCFGLSLINNCLVVLSKQKSRASAEKLIKEYLEIHTLILGIIREFPNTFVFDSKSGFLENLISGLCSVGEITTKQLQIVSTLETWNCITTLALQNSQNLTVEQSESDFGDALDCLVKPMSFLVKETRKNVQSVYSQISLTVPIQKIENLFKLSKMYLKIFRNLSRDFRHVSFLIVEEFISTIAVVLKPPKFIAYSPVYKVIMEQISKNLKEMIPLAYRNDMFLEYVLSEHSEHVHSKEAIHKIIFEILESIVLEGESIHLSERLLDTSFKIISESYKNKSTAKYNQFIEIISALQIRFNQIELKRKILASILNCNTVNALAAINIWCITFRLSHHSTRHSYLKFWTALNERFPMFSISMPAIHTEVLLKKIYNLLSYEYKIKLCNKFNPSSITNKKFLITITLEGIPDRCPTKQLIIDHISKELLGLLKYFPADTTDENFNTMVKYLKLLKTIDCQNYQILEMLLPYLEKVIQKEEFYLLVESILDFIAPRIESIDEKSIEEVLTVINMNMFLFNKWSTKLTFADFFRRVSKLSRFENQCKKTLEILSNNKVIEVFGWFDQSKYKEKCEKLLQEIFQNQTTHEVTMAMQNQTKASIEPLLESLENNALALLTEAECKQLSKCNIEKVKKVISKLKVIR